MDTPNENEQSSTFSEESIKQQRGRPIVCRVCSNSFNLENDEERVVWAAKKLRCPSCQSCYCNLPETERALHLLQDSFFEEGKEEKTMEKLFLLLRNYTKSLFLKSYRSAVETKEDVDYHSYQAARLLVEHYYKNPEFRVHTSFAGLIDYKIQESLWSNDELLQDDLSFNFEGNEEGDNYSFQVNLSNPDDEPIIGREYDLDLSARHLIEIVKTKQGTSNYVNLLKLVGVHNLFQRGVTSSQQVYNYYNRVGKLEFIAVSSLIKDFLKNGFSYTK